MRLGRVWPCQTPTSLTVTEQGHLPSIEASDGFGSNSKAQVAVEAEIELRVSALLKFPGLLNLAVARLQMNPVKLYRSLPTCGVAPPKVVDE